MIQLIQTVKARIQYQRPIIRSHQKKKDPIMRVCEQRICMQQCKKTHPGFRRIAVFSNHSSQPATTRSTVWSMIVHPFLISALLCFSSCSEAKKILYDRLLVITYNYLFLSPIFMCILRKESCKHGLFTACQYNKFQCRWSHERCFFIRVDHCNILDKNSKVNRVL